MVSFNTLRNTVVASALGLATTLGGCAVKQSKPLLRNPNQLERTIQKDIFSKDKQFLQYVDSIYRETGTPPDTLFKEIIRIMELNNKTDRKILDACPKIERDAIDYSKWAESFTK